VNFPGLDGKRHSPEGQNTRKGFLYLMRDETRPWGMRISHDVTPWRLLNNAPANF
jgi:hypothetical protein